MTLLYVNRREGEEELQDLFESMIFFLLFGSSSQLLQNSFSLLFLHLCSLLPWHLLFSNFFSYSFLEFIPFFL